MQPTEQFMRKVGLATREIAIRLIPLDVGDKSPTLAHMEKETGFSRGTMQAAVQYLRATEAVDFQFCGTKGSVITQLNRVKLMDAAGFSHLIGVMPLPYSKKYEGLATGIYSCMNGAGVQTNLAFMRGSDNRLRALKEGRCDFAVMSELTGSYYLEKGEPVRMVLNLGDFTYVDEHVVLVRDDFDGCLNGLRVGVDNSSIDQRMMTASFFEKYKVEYVPLIYSDIINSLHSKRIDAAVWNYDNLDFASNHLAYLPINRNGVQIADTRAVVLCAANNELVVSVFEKCLDASAIRECQKGVLSGAVMPRY